MIRGIGRSWHRDRHPENRGLQGSSTSLYTELIDPQSRRAWLTAGAPMAEQGVERRLAAIMAADVVGYSRLMEADEAATHARLKALRQELIEPAIARHKGRMVKLTGDGALVEFPSAVGAVLAAAEIQRALAKHEAD